MSKAFDFDQSRIKSEAFIDKYLPDNKNREANVLREIIRDLMDWHHVPAEEQRELSRLLYKIEDEAFGKGWTYGYNNALGNGAARVDLTLQPETV